MSSDSHDNSNSSSSKLGSDKNNLKLNSTTPNDSDASASPESSGQNSHREFLHDVGNILFTMQLNLERLSESMVLTEKTYAENALALASLSKAETAVPTSAAKIVDSNPISDGLKVIAKLQKLTERMGLLLEDQRKTK